MAEVMLAFCEEEIAVVWCHFPGLVQSSERFRRASEFVEDRRVADGCVDVLRIKASGVIEVKVCLFEGIAPRRLRHFRQDTRYLGMGAESEQKGVFGIQLACRLEVPEMLKSCPVGVERSAGHFEVIFAAREEGTENGHGQTAAEDEGAIGENQPTSGEDARRGRNFQNGGHRVRHGEDGEEKGSHQCEHRQVHDEVKA